MSTAGGDGRLTDLGALQELDKLVLVHGDPLLWFEASGNPEVSRRWSEEGKGQEATDSLAPLIVPYLGFFFSCRAFLLEDLGTPRQGPLRGQKLLLSLFFLWFEGPAEVGRGVRVPTGTVMAAR